MFNCECGSTHKFTDKHKDAIVNHLMYYCDAFALQNPYEFLADYFKQKKFYSKSY
jgi:hypothetical protein